MFILILERLYKWQKKQNLSNYNYIIFPLAPAARTEILRIGKWQQIWPNSSNNIAPADKIFTDFWHPWNDVQATIHLAFYFMHSIKALGIPLYMTGLSLHPTQYKKELDWILNYQNDCDFNSLKMPLAELNIGIKDLDRKLKTLKAIHLSNLTLQPEYFNDVFANYFKDPAVEGKYGYQHNEFKGHPNDLGYAALADYFAGKIGLTYSETE